MKAPRFQDNRHMQVVRLPVLRTGRLYPSGNITGTHFCWRLSRPQGHCAVGRIMSMKNSNDTIGHRTRYLPVCSTVPQPTALPRARAARGGIVRSRENSICYRFIIIFFLRCFCYCCLVSQAFSPWYLSWTNGDPHRSGFKFQTAVLSVSCVMFLV
jgi:hypothetical protein